MKKTSTVKKKSITPLKRKRFKPSWLHDQDQEHQSIKAFAISKGLKGMVGSGTIMKKLGDNHLLVECKTEQHSKNLLKTKVLAGYEVAASPHRSLNSSRGIIRTRELDDIDEDEIAEELASQSVSNVRRIIIKRDGNTIKTGTYILTFNKTDDVAHQTLPE